MSVVHLISVRRFGLLVNGNAVSALGFPHRPNNDTNVDDEYDHRDNSVRNIGTGIACQLPSETTIDNTENNHTTTKTLMDWSPHAASAGLVEVQMLENTHHRLYQDENEDNNVADDLMVGVELINLLSKDDSECQTNDEKDNAQYLQRCVNEADLVRSGQV